LNTGNTRNDLDANQTPTAGGYADLQAGSRQTTGAAQMGKGVPIWIGVARVILAVALAATALLPMVPASAEQLSFGPNLRQAGWTSITFPGIAPALFKAAGPTKLEVTADTAAGLICLVLSTKLSQARRAHWRWRVHEGVPAMDLTRRGMDDRTLGVYFIFGTAGDAGKSATALLGSPSVTALVFVFGGNRPRGEILPSPHMGRRGKFIVLRHADAEKGIWFNEDVDIASDHVRAFGRQSLLLLAVAIMSDSDDTRKRNRAELEGLTVD
jgi:hypothetical protein